MLIRLESHLRYIKAMQADGEPVSTKGTLAVIDGDLDFTKTDGYIQFMKMVLAHVPGVYGKQDPKWQAKLDEISAAAEKLQEDNVRFTGKTKEEFQAYCENLSVLMGRDVERHLPVVKLNIFTGDDYVPFMEKHIARASGSPKGFLFDEDNLSESLSSCKAVDAERLTELGIIDAKRLAELGIAHDVMMSLSELKLEKNMTMSDISFYLRRPGYHEHVIDALNILIQTVVYAINCSSTKECKAFSFDTQHIHNDLRHVSAVMERARYVV